MCQSPDIHLKILEGDESDLQRAFEKAMDSTIGGNDEEEWTSNDVIARILINLEINFEDFFLKYRDSKFLLDAVPGPDETWFRAAFAYCVASGPGMFSIMFDEEIENRNEYLQAINIIFRCLSKNLDLYLSEPDQQVHSGAAVELNYSEILNDSIQRKLETLFVARATLAYSKVLSEISYMAIHRRTFSPSISEEFVKDLKRIYEVPFNQRGPSTAGWSDDTQLLRLTPRIDYMIHSIMHLFLGFQPETYLDLLFVANQANSALGDTDLWLWEGLGLPIEGIPSLAEQYRQYLSDLPMEDENLEDSLVRWRNFLTEVFQMVSYTSIIDDESEKLGDASVHSAQYSAYVFGLCAATFLTISGKVFDSPLSALEALRERVGTGAAYRSPSDTVSALDQIEILFADYNSGSDWSQQKENYHSNWISRTPRSNGYSMWDQTFRDPDEGSKAFRTNTDLYWACKTGFVASLSEGSISANFIETVSDNHFNVPADESEQMDKYFYKEACSNEINRLEDRLHNKIRDVLFQFYGDEDDGAWFDGIPAIVQTKALNRANADRNLQGKWYHFDFTHIENIVSSHLNRKTKVLDFMIEGFSDKTHFQKAMHRAAKIRNSAAHHRHPTAWPTKKDLKFLQNLSKKFLF